MGRSIEQFYNVAILWKNRVEEITHEENIPLETFMDLIILHTIVETFCGGIPELEITNLLLSKGYEILTLPQKFDSNYSIDIISARGKNINRIIQIKPITTFLSKNENTIKDVKSFQENNEKGIRELKNMGYLLPENCSVKYMVYNSKVPAIGNKSQWLCYNDKFSFSLSELMNKDFLYNIKDNMKLI